MRTRWKTFLLLVIVVVSVGTLEKIAFSTRVQAEEVLPKELTSLISVRGYPGIIPSPTVLEEYRRSGKSLPKIRDWAAPLPRSPVTGERNLLVIMIDFPDTTGTQTQSYYDNLLFGPSQGSMKHYYNEVSYGLLTVGGTMAGSGWYRSAHEMTWWGADSLFGIDDANACIFELAREAVELANANVDFSVYDVNSNNVMDPEELSIVIVHAGNGQESTGVSTDIWSHRWYIYGSGYMVNWVPLSDTFVDGVRISKNPGDNVGGYTMQAEYSPMGTFAHEFGHELGLPDLYDIDYTSDGIGDWGIMAHGAWLGSPAGTCPAHFCAWCKKKLGWIEPTEVTTYLDDAQVSQVETNPTAYLLPYSYASPDPKEYFLVVNREKTGYDAFLPGSGLLIWHIDESVSDNDDETHKMVDLEEAHGGVQNLDTIESPTNNLGDLYDPYFNNPAGFQDATDPNSRAYDASETGLWVTDISGVGETMTADFLTTTHFSNFNALFATNNVRMVYPSESPSKPLECGSAMVSDWLASAFIYTKLETVTEGLDINSGFVNQATGKALGNPGVSIITFGGQFVNPVVKYAESDGTPDEDRAPVKFFLDDGVFRFQYKNGMNIPEAELPQSVINNDQDMFVIEVYEDGDGRYMMLCYGFGWKGTYAAGKYFDTEIYPNLESYPYSWMIVKWEDTNGNGFVNTEADGDTYTIIAIGS